MKVAALLLALVAIASSVPQPKKDFHEHFGDFLAVIGDEAGDDLQSLFEAYSKFDDFQSVIEYVATSNFKDLVFEMESLPEFQAFVAFLENDNIDISFFLDGFNDMITNGIRPDRPRTGRGRLEPSGTNFAAFIQDSIALFPQEKLAALYETKIAEDEVFRVALENLYSDEFIKVFDALWETPEFQNEVDTLKSNGIEINLLFNEIVAIFGQNKNLKM